MLIVTFCFMLAVFYFDYLLQDLVSLCSKNFKEINLQPWLHSYLFASAHFTCVQIGFVNVSIVWRPRVGVGGMGETCCLTFIGILRLLPALQNCFTQRSRV